MNRQQMLKMARDAGFKGKGLGELLAWAKDEGVTFWSLIFADTKNHVSKLGNIHRRDRWPGDIDTLSAQEVLLKPQAPTPRKIYGTT